MIHAIVWESYRQTSFTLFFPSVFAQLSLPLDIASVFSSDVWLCGETTDPEGNTCPSFTRWEVVQNHRAQLTGQGLPQIHLLRPQGDTHQASRKANPCSAQYSPKADAPKERQTIPIGEFPTSKQQLCLLPAEVPVFNTGIDLAR